MISEALHPLPVHPVFLAASPKRFEPALGDRFADGAERLDVFGHAVGGGGPLTAGGRTAKRAAVGGRLRPAGKATGASWRSLAGLQTTESSEGRRKASIRSRSR